MNKIISIGIGIFFATGLFFAYTGKVFADDCCLINKNRTYECYDGIKSVADCDKQANDMGVSGQGRMRYGTACDKLSECGGSVGPSQSKTGGCTTDPTTKQTKCALENPLAGSTTEVPQLIGKIIKAALGIIGALSLVMFVWGFGGWQLAAGNAEKIKASTKTMIFAAVGILIVFISYVFLGVIVSVLTTGKFP